MLRPALEAAGFRIEHSEGAIYLWATRDEDCHASVDYLARMGILVAPETSTAPPRPGTYASPSQQPMSGLLRPLHVSWPPAVRLALSLKRTCTLQGTALSRPISEP